MKYKYRLKCKLCGKEFLSISRYPEICQVCKTEKENQVRFSKTKQCQQCGKSFVAKSPRQKYCSIRCSNEAKKTGKFVLCVNCHKKVWVTVSQLKKQSLFFCSNRCHRRFKCRDNHYRPFGVSPKMRMKLLISANYCCRICGKKHERLFPLEIHHINGNPKDNRIENMIVLCRSCHHRFHTGTLGYNRRQLYKLAKRYLLIGEKYGNEIQTATNI